MVAGNFARSTVGIDALPKFQSTFSAHEDPIVLDTKLKIMEILEVFFIILTSLINSSSDLNYRLYRVALYFRVSLCI